MKKILTALIILLCLFACEVQKELNSTENIWIYAKIISADLNSVNCTIKIVGNDGNSVSGAIVNAVNPANKTISLEYNNGEYRGYFDALISGEYRFLIKTINNGNIQTIEKTVSHTAITEKPKIITISDETGISALTGGNLDYSKKITVGGENADILFKNWVEELLMIQCGLCSDYRPMYHPTTKELTNFPLFAGEIEISDSVSCFLNGLGKIENDTVSLLPYSFCFVNNLTFEQKGNFIVELNEENRNLLCSFYRH